MKESHRFFQNRDCEYFPCHSGVPEAEFSCLFLLTKALPWGELSRRD